MKPKVIVALVVALVLAVGGIWWYRSTADERALRELSQQMYAQCLAQAVTGGKTDAESDAAIAQCDKDWGSLAK